MANTLVQQENSWKMMGEEFKKELDAAHRPEHRAKELLEFIEECKKCA
jgi:hypothetical protein